jgi:P2 family phage contractile tail tube protein
MARNIQVNRVTNANIYIDGASYMGKAEEVTLPEFKPVMAEHKGLGLEGKIEVPAGIDKMEAKIKWASIYKEAVGMTNDFYTARDFQVRSSIRVFEGGGLARELSFVALMSGTFKGGGAGGFKQHENVENEATIAITYLKIIVDNEAQIEFDALANIYIVNGVDLLAQQRQNLGG